MKISVVIDAGIPRSGQEVHPIVPPCTVEDDIKELISLVESYKDSPVEWKTLKRFYTQLSEMKQTERVKNLRSMIKPVLSKYGFHVS